MAKSSRGKSKKLTGKLATMRDYAAIDWKPWKRTEGMRPTELCPSAQTMATLGISARVAFGIMLKTREELIDMHKNLEHATVNEIMERLMEAESYAKDITAMIRSATARILAAGCKHQLTGGKFVIDGRPQRCRA
jgi:hypothetical protein